MDQGGFAVQGGRPGYPGCPGWTLHRLWSFAVVAMHGHLSWPRARGISLYLCCGDGERTLTHTPSKRLCSRCRLLRVVRVCST